MLQWVRLIYIDPGSLTYRKADVERQSRLQAGCCIHKERWCLYRGVRSVG